jgi:dihydrodipicolinate synthase/N-acetylneuraminate lyase
VHSLGQIADAYIAQLERVEAAGGTAVVMASRHLARAAQTPEDYLAVYARILDAASRPVILHWLGTMFDPSLAGYWGSPGTPEATETVLELISAHQDKVAGIKLSLLDRDHEVAFRRRLPQGVRLFTGDDFNYSELIAGDDHSHSDALLGAFAALPRFASAALKRLDAGDTAGFREILDPTVPLSRLVFEAPTQYYKVGVVVLIAAYAGVLTL